MTNKREKLGSLFDLVIDDLLKKIKAGEATAAELNVARQLLKDNNIDALPSAGGPLDKLSKSLVAGLPFAQDKSEVN